MSQLEEIKELVAKKSDSAVELAKQIWNFAELAYKETKSANVMIDALEREGLTLNRESPGSRPLSKRHISAGPGSR